MAQPKFTPSNARPENLRYPAYWFAFQRERILILEDEVSKIPQVRNLDEVGIAPTRELYLGEFGKSSCFGVELGEQASLPAKSRLVGLRELFGFVSEPLFGLAGRAYQILKWDQTHQYCGRCGATTEAVEAERAKQCRNCGLISYPRISPAIIVSIVRGDKILLTRAPHFMNGVYSVQAGFVEPGETLEEAVEREVEEEVGLRVKNVRYFGSQPWPFPHSLMIGFTAEYESGDLVPDPSEVEDARWCAKDELPGLPHDSSIARRLIERFLESQI